MKGESLRWGLERLLRHARVCVEETVAIFGACGQRLDKGGDAACAESFFPRMLDCEKMIDVEDERVGAI